MIVQCVGPWPEYQTSGAAGADLRSAVDETIPPGERRLIPTGVRLEIPHGFEGQVRPRSGLALEYGVTVLNAPGTIDSDYRGEIGVILINHGTEPFQVSVGDRIAQLVIARHGRAEWVSVERLGETGRGEEGYGSTGD